LCPGRRVGAGRRVEALAFVVVGVPGDEPGVVPDLDGFGGHAEAAGHLGQGEHAGVAESLLAAAQPVLVADVADDEPVEGASFAAGQAAVVEDDGDLGVGVVIEELVDGSDGGGGGFAELGGGLPRVFRTAKLMLIHAASCRFRYSSWTSCGVL
jgi:hypothetical protein